MGSSRLVRVGGVEDLKHQARSLVDEAVCIGKILPHRQPQAVKLVIAAGGSELDDLGGRDALQSVVPLCDAQPGADLPCRHVQQGDPGGGSSSFNEQLLWCFGLQGWCIERNDREVGLEGVVAVQALYVDLWELPRCLHFLVCSWIMGPCKYDIGDGLDRAQVALKGIDDLEPCNLECAIREKRELLGNAVLGACTGYLGVACSLIQGNISMFLFGMLTHIPRRECNAASFAEDEVVDSVDMTPQGSQARHLCELLKQCILLEKKTVSSAQQMVQEHDRLTELDMKF